MFVSPVSLTYMNAIKRHARLYLLCWLIWQMCEEEINVEKDEGRRVMSTRSKDGRRNPGEAMEAVHGLRWSRKAGNVILSCAYPILSYYGERDAQWANLRQCCRISYGTLHSKKRARTEGMEKGMESRKQGNKKEWRVTLYIIGL